MKYFVANWKSHKKLAEAEAWVDELAGKYKPKSDEVVVVGAAFPFLARLARKIEEKQLGQVSLAAQDVSPFPLGAYTGAVAAEMLDGMVEAVIVGHSERREYFHETHQQVANKVVQAREVGFGVILCVDEPYLEAQLAALEEGAAHGLIVAYEPLAAIGSGVPQKPEEVKRVVEMILKKVPDVSVLYGGSVTPENSRDYMTIPGVSGLLIGGASLEVDRFLGVINY